MNNSTSHIKWGRFAALIVLMLLGVGLLIWAFVLFITSTDEATLEPTPQPQPSVQEAQPIPAELPQTGVTLSRALETLNLEDLPHIDEVAPTQAPSTSATYTAPAEPTPTAPQGPDWTDLMNRAQIAPQDQPAAAALLFSGSDWKLDGTYTARYVQNIKDPVARVHRIYFYAISNYGSWTQAKAHADANGGQW